MAAFTLGPAMNFEGGDTSWWVHSSTVQESPLFRPRGLCSPGHPQAGRQPVRPRGFQELSLLRTVPTPPHLVPVIGSELGPGPGSDPAEQLLSHLAAWVPSMGTGRATDPSTL